MPTILFVSHSKRGSFYYNDASARYRCVFPAEFMQSIGIKSHVIHLSQVNKVSLSDYSHLVFHRPQLNLKLKHILNKAKRLNIKTIADFDDLIFNPKLAQQSAAVKAGYMSIKLAQKYANLYQKALGLFDSAWVSTEHLKQQMATTCPHLHISVCHNKLPERWGNLNEITPWQQRLENKIIRYMPGTSHHKHDFKKIENLFIELLTENPSIKLEIVGQLSFNINKFPPKQTSQQAHMTFEALPNVISSSWLTIAPLQSNPFNQCKSGLKFWESGLYGVPVISSHLPDIARFKNKGLLLSDNLKDWSNYIKSMSYSDHYQKASSEALKHAKQAVFAKNDERLTIFNVYTHVEKLEKTHQNPAINFADTQLIMCAEYGPRWPSKWLNPTEGEHVAIQNKLSNLEPGDSILKNKERQILKMKAQEKTKKDIPPKKYKVIRKARKLWNSPYDFFRDMKINK